MTKVEKMIKDSDKEENKITICFGEDGIGVGGNVSQVQMIEGFLALISSYVVRTGGDDKAIRACLKAIRKEEEKHTEAEDEEDEEYEEEKKDIKVAKFESLSDMLDFLKKEIDSKKD